MTKRQRRNVGDIVSVRRPSGRLAFACVLHEPLLAFFDYDNSEIPVDVEIFLKTPVAFKVWVMNKAITGGRWPVIGRVRVNDTLAEKPWFFKQDPISKIFSATRGGVDERSATLEECRSLERGAVWSPEHIEERLDDFFSGRSNKWVDSLKVP